MGIVNYHKPDLLLSCGDWGTAVNVEEFYELLKKTAILTIFGNHENMDVLLHETPFLPELFPFMREDLTSKTALEAIKIVKPRLVINGHMHYGGFKTFSFSWGTKYLFINSSQASKHYIILYSASYRFEIWRDLKSVALCL